MDGAAFDRRGARAAEAVRHADDRSADDGRGADAAHRRTEPGGSTEQPDRPLRRRQPQPVDELRLLVGPQEQVDRGEAPVEPVAIHLADGAAGHHDAHRRVQRS